MLSWMLYRRGYTFTVGLSRPEASLLTSTSASPFTGARMKWEGSVASSTGEIGLSAVDYTLE